MSLCHRSTTCNKGSQEAARQWRICHPTLLCQRRMWRNRFWQCRMFTMFGGWFCGYIDEPINFKLDWESGDLFWVYLIGCISLLLRLQTQWPQGLCFSCFWDCPPNELHKCHHFVVLFRILHSSSRSSIQDESSVSHCPGTSTIEHIHHIDIGTCIK